MKNTRFIYFIALVLSSWITPVSGREKGARPGQPSGENGRMQQGESLAASCTPATAKTDMDINNVRATIMTGGDMWWDLANNPRYEVPKGGGAHSIFAGALWIGGLDAGGQLRVAAMTYRMDGNDFWPGPLDTSSASIDASECSAFDRHWKITRKEVEDFVAYTQGNGPPGYIVPQVIRTWPGNGNAAERQGRYLAPYVEVDGADGYNYQGGDYPGYDIDGTQGCNKFQLYGDQTLWWVFNDEGNIHTETGAASIGLEIHAQAFAFATNDEINNMTFYSYKIINRSTISMTNTYFGQWTDADLGFPFDDYVGCDVRRGLGYTYNGVANDGGNPAGGAGAYGANPPAIGMDFFEGPVADPLDGVDNNRNGVTDEPGEQIIMSNFVYYNNFSGVQGNPDNATHYYNYLSGFWKDGTPLTYGGNAYGGTTPCKFMFPGDSDPTWWGTNGIPQTPFPWSEAALGNTPEDRRMLQSAGPFTLQPGAVNYITVGAVWARASSGGPLASVELMRTTDDRAQRLFDNCFRTLDGPTAPDLTIQEMDKELAIYLTNEETTNNYLEGYEGYDPSIVYTSLHPDLDSIDTTYNFEGYQIFQLKNAQVTTADLYDPDKARLVAQCDVRNGITQLVNYTFDQSMNADIPLDMTIEANDEGIFHSFSVTQDAFASGDNRLVNHKTYYFMAIAYAYNRYLQYDDESFDTNDPLAPSNIGQKKPYLAGRKNVRTYSAIPHITSPEVNGTDQNANYGTGLKLTRVEGTGNGKNMLELTSASEEAIVNSVPVNFNGTARLDHVEYEGGGGPVNVKVIDPLNVPLGEFSLQLVNNPLNSAGHIVRDTATWILSQTSGEGAPRTWTSHKTINYHNVFANEQIIPEIGMSVTWSQVQTPGYETNPDKNGLLESSMTFGDPTKDWLTGIADQEGSDEFNWIRAGVQNNTGPCLTEFKDRFIGTSTFLDPAGAYEEVVNGTWGPYRLASYNPNPSLANICYTAGPAWQPNSPFAEQLNKIENLANVDIVLTNDRSKWTRVPVLESGATWALNEGAREAFHLRASSSVDKFGRKVGDPGAISDVNNPDAADFIGADGMGWFPGYAINLETGERLNMAFSENSTLASDNGRDMLFNPNADVYRIDGPNYNLIWGGMHYVYVFGHNGNARYTSGPLDEELKDVPAYDCGKAIYTILASDNTANPELREVYADAMWTNIPVLAEDFADWTWGDKYRTDPVVPSDVKVRLRVAKPYKRFFTGITSNSVLLQSDSATSPQNNNNPMYVFNTAELKVMTNDNASAMNAIDLINVVPNPYYAYSGYETSQFDNRVKFTNLPEKCEIKIYTISGILVRKYTKDSPQTYLDWDLKNQAGIPVASGLYIIHVDVKDGAGAVIGEKVLKWFGVMRPVDLDSY